MSSSRELLGSSKTSRTRTNDCNALASFGAGNVWLHPTFIPSMIDDFNFDLLNRHWVLVDPQHACTFTWGRAQATSKFRKIICCMQTLNGITPVTAIHQVIPVGNEVAKRASVITKRNSAIHAASCLMIQFIFCKWFIHFAPIGNTHRN